jgi:hypothetical protein
MSTPISVDFAAPVVARHDITINAQPDVVWALHTDVNAWPTWQTDITAAHIAGPFKVGASFSWTSFGFSVTSTIYDLVEHTRLLWGGTADGITGIHEWIFTVAPDDVQVTTNESFAGAPIEADPVSMQKVLDGSLQAWLSHLKVAAEARPAKSPT